MWSRKELAVALLVLTAVPAVLTCIDPGWLFPPPTIDSWVYLGFFRHFPEYQAETFPGTYYGSRLSWVLPGYCAHKFLPPVAANCVLHLSVYLLSVLSLFEALRHTASARAALVAALIFAGHAPFLEAVGWDYVDGVGTAYHLLAWAALVRAARSTRPRPWLFAAGVGAAAALYTNLTWLPLLALYLPGYAVLHRRWHGPTLLSDIETQMVHMVCGAAILTAALGWANHRAGGSLLFYLPSVEYALSTAGKENPWEIPVATWLPGAYWLIWPTCAALGSAVYLAHRRLRVAPDAPASAWWPVNFLVAALLFLAVTVRRQPLLQFSYYSSYLLGPLMLACGTLLAAPLARLSRRSFGSAVGIVIGGAALGATGVAHASLAVPLTCALVGFVGLGLQPLNRWGLLGCLALLAAGSALLPPSGAGSYTGLVYKSPAPPLRTRAAFYSRVIAASQYVDEITRTRRTEVGRKNVWFWYDATEPLGAQHMSLVSLWLWGYSMINDQFPTWNQPPGRLASGDLVVVPSQRADVIARALESGQGPDFALRFLDARTVGEGESQIILAVFVLEPRR